MNIATIKGPVAVFFALFGGMGLGLMVFAEILGLYKTVRWIFR